MVSRVEHFSKSMCLILFADCSLFRYICNRPVCVDTQCDQAVSVLLIFTMTCPLGRLSRMSYAEKPEDITKEEWMDKLNNVHIQRADMNRLIMNYLVTGMASSLPHHGSHFTIVYQYSYFGEESQRTIFFSLYFRFFKRDLRRLQRSFAWSLELNPV